jgi:hypothetical protein
VSLEEPAGDPSNTNSEERFAGLKSWFLEVKANSMEDTAENRRYMNVVRTLSVTNPETYREWFDALKSLSKDLLNKSAQKWDFTTGDQTASAEIVRRLLLTFKSEWVNSMHLAQFQGLVNSLSKKQTKNASVTLKSFANKEVAEEIFKTGIQIEVPDADDVPDFSVLPEIMDEESTANKKRKPEDEGKAKKKRQEKVAEEPKKQTPKRKAKRQIQDEEPDEPDEVAPKKRVSFQFEEPTTEVPKESPAIPPNWEQFMPGNDQGKSKKKLTSRRKDASPKVPRAPKKVKKVLTDVQADDYLQCWNYELNVEQTEPVMGLANAMRKANQDSNFRILKASDQKDGERYWGRRLLLKSEFYNTPPKDVKPEHVLKDGAFGVHEATASLTSVDPRNLRRLVWNSGMRFWNISKLVHDAHEGKPKAYLTRENLIQPKGSYFGVDLLGRQRDKNARLILVREIHSAEQSMLCLGGIARIDGGKVVSEVPEVKILLPDSGAVKNEITYEIADALGLYSDNVPKAAGARITTTNGTYETFKCKLTLALSPEDVKKFQPKFAKHSYPEIYKELEFHFPTQPGNHSEWDVLVGTEGAVQMDLIVEFVN